MSTEVISYSVTKPGRVPIKSWVPDLEETAMAQAINLSNLPFAIRHVALMPDAHAGYGMPIGGVLFADRAVVPYAIGVDIGCGVVLAETDLTVDNLTHDELDATLAEIYARVPVGTTSQPRPVDPTVALAAIGLDVPDSIEPAWFARAVNQLGTLGSGNHFLEVQRDEIGQVFVMLHSGSRSLGKTICDAFHKRALYKNTLWHSDLPPGAGLSAGRYRRLRWLLGGDGVRAALRRGEPLADARRRRAGAWDAHAHRPFRSASRRAPQLCRVGEPLRGERHSSTARAPCALAWVRRCSSLALWAPRRTSPRGSATPSPSRRASMALAGR